VRANEDSVASARGRNFIVLLRVGGAPKECSRPTTEGNDLVTECG
jgi:hypothetical protein